MRGRVDQPLLFFSLILVAVGFLIFISASIGLLAKEGAHFGEVAIKQFLFGIVLGGLLLIGAANTSSKSIRKYCLYFYIFSLFLSFAVFIPGLGFEHGGALRWLSIAGFTFQPTELLKLAYLVLLSAWLGASKTHLQSFKKGFLPLVLILGLTSIVFFLQRDSDGILILFLATIACYFIAGGNWKSILSLILLAVIGASVLIATRPYLQDRIRTYLNFEQVDSLGIGYQVHQSLIAIGSGGLWGKGFGQSVQKFQFLPEPIGDSIFAVASEEFGFLGASALIILFLLFALRGLSIASKTNDTFSRSLATGIVILIITESFVNIGSMLAIIPLSGTPLTFVSQGGSALAVSLLEVGILLALSRHQKSS
ncbi:MAG: FtsW/RodA/SpoVE family cell cycle protein [Patescibacteria group bacterium]